MRLLLLTQRIDERDTNLAVHVRWLREIASQFEHVEVIAQAVGEMPSLPNITLHSLGKEQGKNKLAQALRLLSLLSVAVRRADAVLVLMVPLYVIASWPFAAFFRKPIFLWYTHKHVSQPLRLAEKMVKLIFSASQESFRLTTSKVRFLGHAIDTQLFSLSQTPRDSGLLVTVGRIAPVKRLELMIEAVTRVREAGRDVRLEVIGEPILEADQPYAERLKRTAPSFVKFSGALQPERVAECYQAAAACLNASATGSLDKVILEAMACGCPVVTTNEAFREIASEGFVESADAQALADKITTLLQTPIKEEILRARIIQGHDMKTTLTKLIREIKSSIV